MRLDEAVKVGCKRFNVPKWWKKSGFHTVFSDMVTFTYTYNISIHELGIVGDKCVENITKSHQGFHTILGKMHPNLWMTSLSSFLSKRGLGTSDYNCNGCGSRQSRLDGGSL